MFYLKTRNVPVSTVFWKFWILHMGIASSWKLTDNINNSNLIYLSCLI